MPNNCNNSHTNHGFSGQITGITITDWQFNHHSLRHTRPKSRSLEKFAVHTLLNPDVFNCVLNAGAAGGLSERVIHFVVGCFDGQWVGVAM